MPDFRGRLRWGAVLTVLLVATAIVAPWLAPYDPAEQLDAAGGGNRPPGTRLWVVALAKDQHLLADRVRRTADGLEVLYRGHTVHLKASEVTNLTADGVANRRIFLLGSDRFGRDLLSRIFFGTRVSLGIGLLSVALALSLGIAVGSAAALGGRLVDSVLMRGVDALLALPSLFLLLALSGFFRPGPGLIVLILGGTTWMGISRLTRAEILSLKGRDFVLAARALGQRPAAILFRHLLPNSWTPIVVQATLLVGDVIVTEAALSFVGMGIQPPTPSWGNMVADGSHNILGHWWIAAFPGAALALTVIAINLLGDGLRDALDPRTHR